MVDVKTQTLIPLEEQLSARLLFAQGKKSPRQVFSPPVGCQCTIYSHVFLFLFLLCRLL